MKILLTLLLLIPSLSWGLTFKNGKVVEDKEGEKQQITKNCGDISVKDLKNLDVIDTKMKNPNSLLSMTSEYVIYVKTKECSQWRILPETTTDNWWNREKDIIKKFQLAVTQVASIEQKIRDAFKLGKRKKLLMEKAQEWDKALEEYCENSFLGCEGPNVDCFTISGTSYCIWGDDYITSSG